MKTKSIILYLTLNLTFMSAQQYVDILKVSGNTSPFNTFDTSNSKTKINELVADLTVPIKINEKLSMLSGLIYENFQTKLFADGDIKRFGSTTLKIGLNKQLNDQWTGTLVMLPKIASNYHPICNKDFQMGAIGLMKYKKSDYLLFKFGLYYNTELFGPFFVPMAGLYYLSPSKKFETNLMLPLQADANYKIFPFVQVGINFNGQIRSYHLKNVTADHPDTYLARSTNEFYLYLKFNISKSLSLQTKVGQSLGRTYRVYDTGDKVNFGLPATFIGHHRQQLNTDFSNGLIFQVTLLYRFNVVKKQV